jgi:acetyl-CoA synthetase
MSSAGEPLTDGVNQWAIATFGSAVRDHYGQTETGIFVSNHHHPLFRRPLRPRSIGHPLLGWKVEILKADLDEPALIGESGRVAVNILESPSAWFEGYLGDPSRSADRFSARSTVVSNRRHRVER